MAAVSVSAKGTTRRYDSSRRRRQAAETRAAILATAGQLFAERGWSGTGLRDVAGGAGVAVETVYATIGPKPDLLQAVLNVAVVGDDEAVPLAERSEFVAIGVGESIEERAATVGRFMVALHERTWRLELALREAAASDDELQARLRESEERRRQSVSDGAAMVARRPISDTERDAMWALLSVEVYQMLVEFSGWTPERYRQWVEQQVALLFGESQRTSRTASKPKGDK